MGIGPPGLALYRCAYSRTALEVRIDKPRLEKPRLHKAAARLLAHVG